MTCVNTRLTFVEIFRKYSANGWEFHIYLQIVVCCYDGIGIFLWSPTNVDEDDEDDWFHHIHLIVILIQVKSKINLANWANHGEVAFE